MLRILNSQSRKKEPFTPLDPVGKRVLMYTCGPTVYDSLHLGHARAAITPDVVRRYLEYLGYQVRYVTNFTDVDDKIIRRAVAEGLDYRKLTATYIDEFHRMMLALNVKPADAYPRATDHIDEMLQIVERLIKAKHAYVALDGDVYFDTSSFENYGALSKRKLEEEEAGLSGRIDEERLKVKKNRGDFLVWKLLKNDKDELSKGGDAVPRWPSPWGPGRPGWHLECSAMSAKYLGLPFDIHCGGMDLLFPHHEDEKAQSECAFCKELGGKESVNYWVHNAFVNVKARPQDATIAADLVDTGSGGVKMSKSLGNVKWLREMIRPAGPFDPMAVRMLMLSSHYRSPIVFEPALLDEATARLERIYNGLDAMREVLVRAARGKEDTRGYELNAEELARFSDPNLKTTRVPLLKNTAKAREAFTAAMDDDFNTAGALSAVFDLVTAANQEVAAIKPDAPVTEGHATGFRMALGTLVELLQVLGFRPQREAAASAGDGEALVELLMKTRAEARAAKQFALGDKIRDDLKALGYDVEDLPGGKWKVKKK